MAESIKYIDFFAPKNKDTFYLSNFYPLKPPMVIDGETWHTTEHYFQAMKFRGPKATKRMIEYSNTIRDSKTGNLAKMLGSKRKHRFGGKWKMNIGDDRLVHDVIDEYVDVKMREDWDSARLFVMVDALLHKFSEPKLNALITSIPPNTIFREVSPFDVIWGVGKAGTGLNYLGKMLTAVSYGLRGINCGTLSKEMRSAIRIGKVDAIPEKVEKAKSKKVPKKAQPLEDDSFWNNPKSTMDYVGKLPKNECLVDNPMNVNACQACETERSSSGKAGSQSKATAVCIKVGSLRKQSGDPAIDLQKWMSDPNNLYVGRHGRIFIDGVIFPYKGSKWANPYKVGPKDYTLKDSLNMYRIHLAEEDLLKDIHELKGKNLGCFCDQEPNDGSGRPQMCHAQILADMVNRMESPKQASPKKLAKSKVPVLSEELIEDADAEFRAWGYESG